MLRSSISLSLIIFCLVFSCGYCFGQAKVGLAFGANVSRTMLTQYYRDYVQGYWKLDDGYNKAGWHAGLYYEVPLLENITVETGLMLLKRGHRVIDYGYGIDATLHERSLYLALPLKVNYKLHRWVFQTGMSPSYWFAREFQVEYEGNDWEPHYHGFNQPGVDFARFNLALSLGVGYQLPWPKHTSVLLEFHQLGWKEKAANSVPVFALANSNYFSFTTKVALANAEAVRFDSLGIYWKLRAGTEFQFAYGRALGSGYFPGAHPFSFKGGLLAGKRWGQWNLETGLLYARRKKLFGNLYTIQQQSSPMRAIMDHGVELRKDLLEIPLNLKYFLHPSFYLLGGLSSLFELETRVEVYHFGEMNLDRWEQFREKQVLIAINGGAGYKLPAMFGHPVYIEAVIQQGVNKIEANYTSDMGYRPLVGGLNLDIEF